MKAFKIAAIAAGILLASSVGSASIGGGNTTLPCGAAATVDRDASTNPKVAKSGQGQAPTIRGVRSASAQ